VGGRSEKSWESLDALLVTLAEAVIQTEGVARQIHQLVEEWLGGNSEARDELKGLLEKNAEVLFEGRKT